MSHSQAFLRRSLNIRHLHKSGRPSAASRRKQTVVRRTTRTTASTGWPRSGEFRGGPVTSAELGRRLVEPRHGRAPLSRHGFYDPWSRSRTDRPRGRRPRSVCSSRSLLTGTGAADCARNAPGAPQVSNAVRQPAGAPIKAWRPAWYAEQAKFPW